MLPITSWPSREARILYRAALAASTTLMLSSTRQSTATLKTWNVNMRMGLFWNLFPWNSWLLSCFCIIVVRSAGPSSPKHWDASSLIWKLSISKHKGYSEQNPWNVPNSITKASSYTDNVQHGDNFRAMLSAFNFSIHIFTVLKSKSSLSLKFEGSMHLSNRGNP